MMDGLAAQAAIPTTAIVDATCLKALRKATSLRVKRRDRPEGPQRRPPARMRRKNVSRSRQKNSSLSRGAGDTAALPHPQPLLGA
jgi:hypothetical protein